MLARPPGSQDNWFKPKATETQWGRSREKVVWRCIRDMQHGRRGLVPLRSVVVRDEDGNPCNTPTSLQRWRRHFDEILNMQSQFDDNELKKVKQSPLRPHMAEHHGTCGGSREAQEW